MPERTNPANYTARQNGQPANGGTSDRTTLFSLSICSLFFGFWTLDLTGRLGAGEVILFLALPSCAWLLGRSLLHLARIDFGSAHPVVLTLLTGFLAVGLLLLFLSAVIPWSLRNNSVLAAGLCLAAALLMRPLPTPTLKPQEGILAGLTVVVVLTAVTFWTRDLRPYTVEEEGAVVYKPWIDHFVQAKYTALVGIDGGVFRQSNWDLSGTPGRFYHYASFTFPATLRAWSHQSAYDVVASIWVPLGLTLMGFAACALAASRWGGSAGLAAVIGLLLLPDTSSYGLHFSWYSFHWLLEVNPGLTYGLACSALGLLFVVQGSEVGRWRTVSAGILGAGTLLLVYKAQLLPPVILLLGLYVVLFFRGLSLRWRLVIFAVGGLLSALAGLVGDRMRIGPTLVPQALPYNPRYYLSTVVKYLPRSTLSPLFDRSLSQETSLPGFVTVAALFVLTVTTGLFTFVYPVVLGVARRLRRLEALDAVPGLVMLLFFASVLLMPVNERGNWDEIQHRGFVWVYFIWVVWCSGKFVRLISAWRPFSSGRLAVTVGLASVLLLSVPWLLGQTILDNTPASLEAYHRISVPRGLVDCAAYLRTHSAPDDVIEDSKNDNLMILSGLSERPCYYSSHREFDAFPIDLMREERKARAARLQSLRSAATTAELRELLGETHIRWYVAHPDDQLGWPETWKVRSVYTSHGFTIYDLNALCDCE